ncbi:WD repeat-containing protein 55 [Zea mays]|uniref:WD repeat-containing protein 55 n=1 Tax=Zea mays TaxID=4577 RepID=A0A3L6DLZ4_MAIZE|nr:WD repeat-containing protein 55 [Zea mays]
MEALHEEMPFDLDFHPSSPLVVTSIITGELCLFRYGPESQPERLLLLKAHKESCRAVRFVDSGKVILSGSADCSVLASDVESGKAIARLEDAHENAINRLVCLTESTIATGDDEGCIKVWDTRERSCCNSFEVHDDYISDMTYVAETNQILATSGDGTLSVNNLRRNKVRSRSEFSEDELLSLVLMKLDEDTLVSGSSDGVIRLVGILPNRIKQPLAEHSEYPIEALALSNDKKYLGSISHDKMLKLWDLEELLSGPQVANGDEPAEAGSDDSDDDSDDDVMDVDMAATSSKAVSYLLSGGGCSGSRSKKAGKGQSSSRPASDFFADL